MNGERKARLTAAGIQVDQALERMMGSEALLERLLGEIPGGPELPGPPLRPGGGRFGGGGSRVPRLKGGLRKPVYGGTVRPFHPPGWPPCGRAAWRRPGR